MSDLTYAQQTVLEQAHVRYAYFVEFHFASAVARLSTLNINLTWGGHEWVGMGAVGNISPMEQAQGTNSRAMDFTLSLPQTEWLYRSVGAVEEYRGRQAKMYFCPLGDDWQPIGEPLLCWHGTMDSMPSSISGTPPDATGSITLRCETSAYGLRRPASLRLNAAQHKQRHPNDTGLDRLTALLGKQLPWLSKKFQQR
jgi:hypothetical protein